MTPEDIPFYEQYIKLVEGERGVRLILAYPEDYISLLKEVKRLTDENNNLRNCEIKYIQEAHARMACEDKLLWLRKYCRDNDIRIPNFKW